MSSTSLDGQPDVDAVAALPGRHAVLDGLLEGQLLERVGAELDDLLAQRADVALRWSRGLVEQLCGSRRLPARRRCLRPVSIMSSPISSCTGPSWIDSATWRRASLSLWSVRRVSIRAALVRGRGGRPEPAHREPGGDGGTTNRVSENTSRSPVTGPS